MLESHITNLQYKYNYPHGIIYDQMIYERNKIIRRDYTIRERYFSGSRIKTKIETVATEKAYKIIDRYHHIKAQSKKLDKIIV